VVAEKNIYNTFFKTWMLTLYDSTAFKVEITFPAELSLYLKVKELVVIYVNGFYHNIMSYSYDTNKQMITLLLMKRVPPNVAAKLIGDFNSDFNNDFNNQ
jgi:hypothetical protein